MPITAKDSPPTKGSPALCRSGAGLNIAREKVVIGKLLCSRHSIAQFLDELRALLQDSSAFPRTLLCVNAHIFNLACRDKLLREVLNRARINAADGMAIVWAGRWLGHPFRARCNMTEAYHAFLRDEAMPPSKAILLGCSEAEAAAAADRANRLSPHCRIVAAYSGFLSTGEYRDILSAHGHADLILLGMGTPKTEFIAELAAEICPGAVVWGIGGGTIRIDAGTIPEAPRWLRKAGLQWLHRLLHAPRALWSRYLIGNPVFVGRILFAGRKCGGGKAP